MNDYRIAMKCFLLAALFTTLFAKASVSRAASDTDVLNIEATSVTIEDDRIIIVGKAEIRMRVFAPEKKNAEENARFFGRNASWVVTATEKATFTVHRPKQGEVEWWEKMSVEAAKALKNGGGIGRIGYYRPEVILKENAVHSISGYGYLYPQSDE